MRVWSRCRGMIAAAALVPALAVAKPLSPPRQGEKVVPMSRSGIVPLDLQVGRMIFRELLVQGVPADPEAILALPADKLLAPKALLIATNGGREEVEMRLAVSFLDADGAVVVSCSQEGEEQNEETNNEVREACDNRSTRVLPAQWARVTSIRVQASVVEQD